MTRTIPFLLCTLAFALACDPEQTVLEPDFDPGQTATDSAELDVNDANVTGEVEQDIGPAPDLGDPEGSCQLDKDCFGQIELLPCQTPRCQNGGCILVAGNDDIPCNDGDICKAAKTCLEGQCQGGQAIDCNDYDPCTDDQCNPTLGCTYAPASGACDDGNPCTLADHCEDSKCVAGNSVCPCEDDSQCAEWDDGNPCNGALKCLAGVCKIDPDTVVICPPSGDANPCQTTGCDPKSGNCTLLSKPGGTPCDDGDSCTIDQCLGGTCTPGISACPCSEDADCLVYDDGDFCNGVMRCDSGQCVPNPDSVVVCPGSEDPCSTGGCNPAVGECQSQPFEDGIPCDDNNICTAGDACNAGVCTGIAKVCDDNNQCTDDFCNDKGVCESAANVAACDDGDPCTIGDTCNTGYCVPGLDECKCTTDDDCLKFQGDPCDGIYECVALKCINVPGSAVQCDPTNVTDCGVETCSNGQCVMAPINEGAPCFSGSSCADVAACQGGKCTAIGEKTCVCDATDIVTCGTQKKWSNDAFGSTTNIDAWDCFPGDFSGREYAWTFVTNKPVSVTAVIKNEQSATNLFWATNKGFGCAADGCEKAATSKLTFLAKPDTPYYLIVDGKNGEAGKFDLAITCSDSVESKCSDQVDNDGDNKVDCDDEDCETDINCGSENCTNGIDDDDDMLVDCSDDDCAILPVCESACFPAAPAYCGLKTFWQTDGYGSSNDLEAYACGGQTFNGPEFVYSFPATKSGEVNVQLTESFLGHSIFVLQDQGGGCNATTCIQTGAGEVSFYAAAGVQYYIVIDGGFGASGDYKIEITCPNPF